MKIKKDISQKTGNPVCSAKKFFSDGVITFRESCQSQPALKDLIAVASAIVAEDKELRQQKEDLLFSYRTLVEGYKRYRNFFNNAADGYLVTDLNGLIKEVNQTALTMLSSSGPELLNKSVMDIIPELRQGQSGLQADLLAGSRHLETTLHIKDREPFQAAISFAPYYSTGNEPVELLWQVRDINDSREDRNTLEFYVMQIQKIQEEEKKQIVYELHEEILQSLAALSLRTGTILDSKGMNHEEIFQSLKQLNEGLGSVIEDVRRFSYELRPGVLDYLGLIAALETLAADLNSSGINAQLIVDGKERSAAPDKEIALFRIAQEAAANIKKYSHAAEASISVCYTNNEIRLTITDNGRGFESPQRLCNLAYQGKLGLIGIEERARLFGGKFSVQSQPERGTKITVILPFSDHTSWTAGANSSRPG